MAEQKKLGGDGYVKNFRPITLLNVEYKIFSKYLVSILNKNDLFDPMQKGFVPKPGVEEHAFLMKCLFEQDQSKLLGPKNPLFALFLDVSGGFDTVPHDVLLSLLLERCGG